ncbi:MAG: Si-specific NAD(P)(+) transhydrogenase [Candidatus Riflebacteria bacterium]|nr:Si-specific NAD(P)(+) transhydrogenase [Candidatus Riflebacteria bacterium]
MPRFDVIIIGGGPAGERAAVQAARAARRAAIVERASVVGGTCINWGTIPSKSLRESALFVHALTRNRLHGIRTEITDQITVGDFMYRKRVVVQRELDLINEVLDQYRIEVFQGQARFVDAHTVTVLGQDGQSRAVLTGDVVVIATGSSPARPPEVPFDQQHVFDSDTILELPRMPRSMVVLGAGVIGIEYAATFAALGLQITLVDTRDRLLPYFDREMADLMARELKRLGIIILHDERHTSIELSSRTPPRVLCRTTGSGELEADVLLYCVGRDGNTRGLGLEAIGLTPDPRGLLTVNEHFQTSIPHIYAVGDVIGYPALASTSMEQGRQAIRHAFGIPGVKGKTDVLPFAIYAIPEASYIGETQEELEKRGADYVVGRGRYGMNPRGQIVGDTTGLLKLLFEGDALVLRGVHVVGFGASELVHIGQAYLQSGSTASQIAETLFNYPTLSDLYRHAALEALREHRLKHEP